MTRVGSVRQNDQTGSGTHTAPRPNDTGVLYREQRGRGVKLPNHLHPVPSLGIAGFTTSLQRNNFDLFIFKFRICKYVHHHMLK
jgi:hypothetical protein